MKKSIYSLLFVLSMFITSCQKDPLVKSANDKYLESQEKVLNTPPPTPSADVCFNTFWSTVRSPNFNPSNIQGVYDALYSCLGVNAPNAFPVLLGAIPAPRLYPAPPPFNGHLVTYGDFNNLLTFLNLSSNSTQAETDQARNLLKPYNAVISGAILGYNIPITMELSDKKNIILMYGHNNSGFTLQQFSFFAQYVDILYAQGFVVTRAWQLKLYYDEMLFTDNNGNTSLVRVPSLDLSSMQIPVTF